MMYKAIVFLPLAGFLIAGLLGRMIGTRASQIVTSGLLVISAILSIMSFLDVALGGNTYSIHVANWVSSGDLEFNWAFKIDTLTSVMLVVVTLVSALVHIYSIGYMSHDEHNPRFFAYLSMFTFAMLMLVTADNFLQMFFGWEGVGLASYLLIGFWYKKPTANAAAIKAFFVNRIGDFGFSLGILATFLVFGSVHLDTVFAAVPDVAGLNFMFIGFNVDIITTICILLFIGAMGKSAQLGLHTWLPDAMEGPTPVSALIHAATMVTAGVFLVVRCSPMFEYSPVAMAVVAIVGATTAIVTASIGLVQNDIKRVIAYSTCSQLGYMFFAAGVGAYGAAIFHLFTHAFFKALLFLGSGSVIHAMSDEQDMRKMGGIRTLIPGTYILMIIGTLALTGIFPFAGYFSKDMILESAYAAQSGIGEYAFVMGVSAALMTSFYSWRLIFMTFHGKPRASESVMRHVHESPMTMMVPLIVLAIGATAAGGVFYDHFVGDGRAVFWGNSILVLGDDVVEAAHHVPGLVKFLPLIMSVAGFALAYQFYIRKTDLPRQAAEAFSGAYKFILNKWYFDELFDFLFVRPAFRIGHFLWKIGDGRIIDGFGPDGVSSTVMAIARRVRTLQTGYLYHYAFAMLIGVASIVTYLMYVQGGQ
jgi:NADH-quinone oxidoreductase subunit L